VLHRILLQYALWADIAGIDDITTPNIHDVLFRSDVMNEWKSLREEIGYEVGIV
jgi:hypothetical protein